MPELVYMAEARTAGFFFTITAAAAQTDERSLS